ncbi:hypothetical protein ABIE67_005173 [Streptomyces sp. V4I8]|uniref:hypothetical protein n=1 Tax=Streptomyces sp. V4I8 TaxID=3156469 RepID=UPI003517D833
MEPAEVVLRRRFYGVAAPHLGGKLPAGHDERRHRLAIADVIFAAQDDEHEGLGA